MNPPVTKMLMSGRLLKFIATFTVVCDDGDLAVHRQASRDLHGRGADGDRDRLAVPDQFRRRPGADVSIDTEPVRRICSRMSGPRSPFEARRFAMEHLLSCAYGASLSNRLK
jgi:hypothetical protein